MVGRVMSSGRMVGLMVIAALFTGGVSSAQSTYYSTTFDGPSMPAGWTISTTNTPPWQWGTPSGTSPDDHTSGAGQCFGTNLAGNHVVPCEGTIYSPTIDLTTADFPFLDWYMWVECDFYDGVMLYASVDGAPATQVLSGFNIPYNYTSVYIGLPGWAAYPPFGSNPPWTAAWTLFTLDCSAYVGHTVQFSWRFHAEYMTPWRGIYIDDLDVYEYPYVASVTSPDPVLVEPATNGSFRINLSYIPTANVPINYTVGGTATAGVDYVTLPGTATVIAPATFVDVPVTVIDSVAVENPVDIVITLQNTGVVRAGLPGTVTLDVFDKVPVFWLTSSDVDADEEGTDSATIDLNFPQPPTSDVTVYYQMSGTATYGTDYDEAGLPGSILIPALTTSPVTLTLNPYDDTIPETDETSVVTLSSSPDGSYAVTGSPVTITIADNEPEANITTPTLTLSEPGIAGIDGSIDVTLVGPSGDVDGTVYYTVNVAITDSATPDVDYVALTGSVTCTASGGGGTIDIDLIDDNTGEKAEIIDITLSAGSTYVLGTAVNAQVTIDDDEKVAYIMPGHANADAAAAEEAQDPGTVVIRLEDAVGGDTNGTVYYSITGTASAGDFTALPASPVTVPPTGIVEVVITPNDDAEYEGLEDAIFTLLSSPGYLIDTVAGDQSFTVTIADNDPLVQVSAVNSPTAEASGAPASFRFDRGTLTNGDLTVSFQIAASSTATPGAANDYDDTETTGATPTVVIPDGDSSVDIDITATDDLLVEDQETIVLQVLPSPGVYTVGANAFATVLIDDNEPEIWIDTTAPDHGTEGADDASITLILEHSVSKATPLTFQHGAATGSSASEVFDYTLNALTLQPTDTSPVTIPIVITDDTDPEGPEDIIFQLVQSNGYRLRSPLGIGEALEETLTITDNEPVVTVATFGGSTVTEDTPVASGTFRISVTVPPPTVPLVVDFSLAGSTATSDSDYDDIGTSATVAVGAMFVDVSVDLIDDQDVETDEALTLTITPNIATYGVGAADSATLTIADNEPVVTISGSQNGAEPSTDAQFTITATPAPSLEITVPFSISGTATPGVGQDYAAVSPLEVDIPAGTSSVDVDITVQNDNFKEQTETVILTLGSDPTYTLGATTSQSLDILDDEPEVSIEVFTDAQESGVEGHFLVLLTNTSTADIVVQYAVSGTATPDGDYTSLTGSVTVLAGQSSAQITVTPSPDGTAEQDETIIVTLLEGTDYYLDDVSPTEATMLLLDDEPRISIEKLNDAAEPDTGGLFRINTTAAPSGSDLTVYFTVAGTASMNADYADLTDADDDDIYEATIADGQLSGLIPIVLVLDDAGEGDESVILTLHIPSGMADYSIDAANDSAALIITDDEPQAYVSTGGTYGDADASEPSDDGAFVIHLTHARDVPTLVNFIVGGTAIGGTDYTALTGSATVDKDKTFVVVPVEVLDDALDPKWEPADETVHLTIIQNQGYALGTPVSGTVNIDDDEPTVNVEAVDPTSSEDGDTGMFRFYVTNGPATRDIAVGYAVTGDAIPGVTDDYTPLPGMITIPLGYTSVFATVTPYDDNIGEGVEDVTVTIKTDAAYAIGTASGNVTITDNEPLAYIDASPTSVPEGGTVTLTIALFTPAPSDTVVYYQVTGLATNGTDYNGTPALTDRETILEDEMEVEIVVDITDDNLAEGPEFFVVTLLTEDPDPAVFAPAAYRIFGLGADVWVTITDNEPVVTLDSDDAVMSETDGERTANITFEIDPMSDSELTVNFTITGTATPGVDFDDAPFSTGQMIIPPYTEAKTVLATAFDDLIPEGTETFVITLNEDPGLTYRIGTEDELELDLLDDEPVISISTSNDTTSEAGGPPANFILTSTVVAPAAGITVNFIETGTALSVADYQPLPATVFIQPGTFSTTTTVTAVDDILGEGLEHLNITIAAGSGYTIDQTKFDRDLYILDDEPTVDVIGKGDYPTPPYSSDFIGHEEGQEQAVFEIVLSKPAQDDGINGGIVVNYDLTGTAANGVDYVGTDGLPLPGSIVVPVGTTTVLVIVIPIDDYVGELTEDVVLTIRPGPHYQPSASGTYDYDFVEIIDDEPVVTVEATKQFTAEYGPEPGKFTVVLSEPAEDDGVNGGIVVYYVVSGTATPTADYVQLAGSVVVLAGTASANILVDPQQDWIVEGQENVEVLIVPALYYSVGSPDAAIVYIDDDEPSAGVIYEDYEAFEEGPVDGVFIIYLYAPAAQDVIVPFTFHGTATAPDFVATPASEVTIPAGSLEATVTIGIVDDQLDESYEIVENVLANGAHASIKIIDNDPQPVVLPYFEPFDGPLPPGWGMTSPWEHGVPVGGPGADHTTGMGSCLGTNIDGPYPHGVNGYATTPPFDIPEGATDMHLSFWTWMRTYCGYPELYPNEFLDGGCLEVSRDGEQFWYLDSSYLPGTETVPYNSSYSLDVLDGENGWGGQGLPEGWFPVLVDLSPFAGHQVRFRFRFASDEEHNAYGWYVDDLMVGAVPVVSLQPLDGIGFEAGTDPLAIAVTSDRILNAPLDVTIAITGTATNGTDYVLVDSTVTIPAGSAMAVVDGIPIDDNVVEGDETIKVDLQQDETYIVDAVGIHSLTGTIVDDEPPASIEATTDTVEEGSSTPGVFTITLATPATQPTQVNLVVTGTATEGVDYPAIGTSVLIPTGSDETTLSVFANLDNTVEPDETAIVDIGTAGSGQRATVIIQGASADVDFPKVLINEVNPVPDSTYVELRNMNPESIDLANWQAVFYFTGAGTFTYTFPQGAEIAAGGFLILHEDVGTDTATELYVGQTLGVPWTFGTPPGGAVRLLKIGGTESDYVVFGSATTLPPPSWNGAAADMPTIGQSVGRDSLSTDTDDRRDWENTGGIDASIPTQGYANAGGLAELILGLGGGADCTPGAGSASAALELIALFALLFTVCRFARRTGYAG